MAVNVNGTDSGYSILVFEIDPLHFIGFAFMEPRWRMASRPLHWDVRA
jgi:hypothetical protein